MKKVALVTGASGGIGRAAAVAFADAGYRTVVSDIKDGQDTVDMINSKGKDYEAIFLKADVSKEADVVSLIKNVKDRFGRLDCAFNNAGVDGHVGAIEEDVCNLDNWNFTIGVNLTGVFLCCKHELALMSANSPGGGAIVNCSSVAGKTGHPLLPAYAASKHGVLGLTKSIAISAAPKGIRVNAVCPGIIATEMIDRIASSNLDVEQLIKARQAVGRAGRPEEVAAAVVFLCSDAASLITGTALDIDGGWLAT